ncbi:hypothetical protein [Brachybacterium alimentarium]|uniref:hypothetical protein n=1 Tax=Brachybacterium alimentarium TaxID=47845 RepID=UPI0015F08EF1|nr:hypothetical protein [Brachybacterium alimentarium]
MIVFFFRAYSIDLASRRGPDAAGFAHHADLARQVDSSQMQLAQRGPSSRRQLFADRVGAEHDDSQGSQPSPLCRGID